MRNALHYLRDPEVAVIVCVGVSAALILGAHGFERIGGYPPCLLCLDQREAHWAAIAAGGIALGFSLMVGQALRTLAAALGALTLLYLFSTGLAGYHAGIEWGFWPGPEACAPDLRGGMPAGSDILASLKEGDAQPACSDAAWRMLGISMAGFNALISLGLAGVAMFACYHVATALKRHRVGPARTSETL